MRKDEQIPNRLNPEKECFMNHKVASLIREAIPAIVNAVASGAVASSRIRFTGVGENVSSFNNFVWIMVDTVDGDAGRKLWAHTNDADFMVGYPPSFSQSVPAAEGALLVEPIIAFLEEKLARFGKVEVLLQTDVPAGAERVPNFVGDSERGFAQLAEQPVHDIC